MKLQDLSIEQLQEIVNGAPDGAEYWNSHRKIYMRYKEGMQAWVPLVGWEPTGFAGEPIDSVIKLSDIRTRIKELEPKQKYDWSNVPDVVNWLATDKDGDCAWGFLEEPVIELEDEEWRPVAPYTEIYINGSNGTVAAHKGDWRESLEQRKFKIGDKVTFIRNIEPFQWGAKAKVYEVVDVADNLPTSTDQRVWLDTTASSPHLSRNLCLATAIGQVGIEDLPIHGEPISSEIITNVPVIDELEPVFKVGDWVVPESNAINLVRAVREVLEVDGDQIRYHMEAQVRSYWSKAKGWRHATPEEEAAGHRIDDPLISDEMASPCAVSDLAENNNKIDLVSRKDCQVCIEEETPELFESKHCSPRPMVDHELKAPASASQQQIGGNHYTKLAIQPMHYSLANNLNAAQHTIIKYVTRYQDKGGVEDLLKARHTLDLLIEHLKGEQGE